MIISSIYYLWQLITFLELLRITLDLHTDLEYNNVAKNIGFRMALNRFDTQHGGKKQDVKPNRKQNNSPLLQTITRGRAQGRQQQYSESSGNM